MIYLAAGLLIAAALALGIPLDEELGRLLGVVSAITVLMIGAFDRWLWRYLPLSLTERPDLRGTWRASLSYEEAGRRIDKRCYLIIEQTYSRISVDLVTAEGCSHSTSAGIVRQGLQQVLSYSYRNEPSTLLQGNSPTHRGAAALMVSTKPRIKLSGDYWTERFTKGQIQTTGHNRHRLTDFNSAESAEFK